jgi:hypothetical protein
MPTSNFLKQAEAMVFKASRVDQVEARADSRVQAPVMSANAVGQEPRARVAKHRQQDEIGSPHAQPRDVFRPSLSTSATVCAFPMHEALVSAGAAATLARQYASFASSTESMNSTSVCRESPLAAISIAAPEDAIDRIAFGLKK